MWLEWKDRVAGHEGLSERKEDLRVKGGARDESVAWQNHYMWAASPHDSQTPQLQPCPNLKWNLFSSLWNVHFRFICPNFHRFCTIPNLQKVCHFSSCHLESLVCEGCVCSLINFLWLLVIRLCPCRFSLWDFSIFFCCYYERDFGLWGSFHRLLRIFSWSLLLKKSFLDQLLPKHEPISSLVFLDMFLENGTQPAFSANADNCSISPTWIPELITAHK